MSRGAVNRKYYLLVWLVAIVILFGTLASGLTIWSLRSNAIDDAIGDAHNIATVLSEQTASSVQSIEIVLHDLQDRIDASNVKTSDDFQRVVSTKGTHEFLTGHLSRLSQAEVITLADRHGRIINFTRSWPIPPINLADRDYFKYAKANNNGKVYVSIPVPNKVTGTMTIYFSRRVSGSNGEFLGIALVGVGLDYFQNIYSTIKSLDGQVFNFLRTDGTIVLRYPGANTHSGEKMPSGSPWYQVVAKGGGDYWSPGYFDGRPRLVAVQPLKNYPLVVNIVVSEEAALQKWHSNAIAIGAGAGATLLCLAVLLSILLSQLNKLACSEDSLAGRSRELEEANVKLDAAVNNMSHGICMFNAEKQLIFCNELYRGMYRLPPELLKPGTLHSDIIAHRVRNSILKNDGGDTAVQQQLSRLASLSLDKRSIRIDEHADGKLIRVVREPMRSGGWVATHEDITEQQRAEQELGETKKFLASIIENIPVAVVVKDAKTRKFIHVNRAFEALLALPRADLLGRTVFDIYGKQDAEILEKSDCDQLERGVGVYSLEYEIETPVRGARILATNRIVISGPQGEAKYLIVVIDDVTERRQSEQRIAFMAHHDALTGLANRVALAQKIEDATARQRRRGEAFSVLLLDLDRFKAVNDSLGHPAGDALLREAAKRLKKLLRETDVLARLGGDEFAIIQAGEANQREAASGLASRIVAILAEPFDIEGKEVNISASIGIAVAAKQYTDSDSLLKMADLALYRAKSAGRSGYCFFDPAMSEAANARHEIESELRSAIKNDEMKLYYQPIIDAKTRKICGAEALIRWQHPTKGMIAPDQFIPLAEETGLIAQIGEWVLHTACMEAAGWPAHVKIAVNLSPVQFRKANLPDVVMCALAKSGLPAERLELEITETALIESAAECLPALHHFKRLGIAVALDDFGTGYSSLSQITMFPFDKIKIDKSFTQNITKRSDSAAIVLATLSLAQSLDIATTAEGVETTEQCRLLGLAGVTSLQGYLFKRPGPASEIDFGGIYGDLKMQGAA